MMVKQTLLKVRLKFLGILCCCNFFGCSSPSKLQQETVFSEMTRLEVPQENSEQTTFRNTRVAVTAQLEPKIEVVHQDLKSIRYQLQGFVSSSGLAIRRVKQIGVEKEITGDSLLVKHTVEIVRIPGKEGSLVLGYNYSQMESIHIPDAVRFIRIELYEQKAVKSAYDRDKETLKHIATTELRVD